MKTFKLFILSDLLVLISGFSCVRDEKLKTEFSIEAIEIGDGWKISSLATEGFNESAFKAAVMSLIIQSIVITSYKLQNKSGNYSFIH
jgi:hypothetical protein